MDNMKNWLSVMKLSSEYDRRARLAPALASFLPFLPLILALGGNLQEWGLVLGGTTGACALGAFVLANFASAMGNRLQEQLWPDWPFDAPTHVRLMPDNPDTSPQQRALWYTKVEQVTGLDLQTEVDRGDRAAIRATINDAVERLRNRFRHGDSQARHDEESIRYGSARNFAGMRPLWLSVSVLSCAGTWAAYRWADSNLVWPIVASLLPVPLFVIAYRVLPRFVRIRARYYCEVFFQLLEAE
ncbi:hypothetical protein [Candidatus Palauibacter irciniicola]|uniref:hypothetical protein n=1 Tax=Candidatus Palauibacter irciniicola TaxID=3056733 RepID=UPI003B02CE27